MIEKEFIKILLDSQTIKKAKKLFLSNQRVLPINMFNISCRLLKTNIDTINLEVYLNERFTTTELFSYFKNIGFYIFKSIDDKLLKDFKIVLSAQFQNYFITGISDLRYFFINKKVTGLSKLDNSIIASCAMQTYFQVKEMFNQLNKEMVKFNYRHFKEIPFEQTTKFDRTINLYGLDLQLMFNIEGFIMSTVDNIPEIKEDIIMGYSLNLGELEFITTNSYNAYFDELKAMNLLEAFPQF